MTEKSKKVSILRKVFVSAALLVLLGLFFTLYFFVYIPQQQTAYEKSTFRILKEMAENFKDRVQGIDTADMKSAGVLSFTEIPNDSNITKSKLIDAIKIPQGKTRRVSGNSLSNVLSKQITDSVRKTVADLMTQIVGLHATNFESVILIRTDSGKDKSSQSGTIIYSSSNLALDDAVNVDSIYKKNSFFIYPATFDLEAEALKYKLFILPFKLDNQRLVIGGFISDHNYKVNSRSFPVLPLVILAVLLVVILASLPFLKVFLLSPQENISVRDVRSIIAMIYIAPFIFIILISCAWLYSRAEETAITAITDLHSEVSKTFYKEINDALLQLKSYNSVLQAPGLTSNIRPPFSSLTAAQRTSLDLKEAVLHPRGYKNFDGVFWIDSAGQEIAKWNFSKDSVYFFDKKDRQYVKDLQRHEGYVLPDGYLSDTFSIQPTLAKSTGDYTVSIVTHTHQTFDDKRATMIGLSGKLYSVFNPVVPKGLNFCIIDQTGKTLFHSEYGRNLQENIFEETRNALPLKLAVNRKDSSLLSLKLYERDADLLISPLKGVPYYLITYSYKRNQVLHVFHILGFTFLTQSFLLLIIALISLFFYYSNSKFSQLFFVENDMEFAKPSELKKEYYKHLFAFHTILIVFSIVMSLFFTGQKWLVFVLNLCIQLPVFSIMGYYIIRCLENNCVMISESKREGHRPLTTLKKLWTNPLFRKSILKVLIPYFVIIFFFQIYKDTLLNTPRTAETALVDGLIILLEILVPVLAVSLKIFGLPTFKKTKQTQSKISENSFLHYFINALLLSAIVTTMVPVIGLLLYAGNQEKLLQLKSNQMYEAKKIQDRRVFVNARTAKTKLFSNPAY
ncbi:MAG TPA: hypothetical protein VLJ41_09325, partial [Segetibacter sp.]|nr:hypothetical protein [Segetibacter sp.]